MARKRRQEEHENHERWLVSYADFITLLFAFFVVMYSISSVNDGKYRVLSETLTDAFLTSAQSMDPIQIGEKVRTTLPVAGEYAASEPGTLESSDQNDPLDKLDEEVYDTKGKPEAEGAGLAAGTGEGKARAEATLSDTADKLKSSLGSFIDEDLVSVTVTERGVEVEMKSKALFPSGSARLSRKAISMMRSVARILAPLPNQIEVEGHTDNVPIKTILFPSNWELSATRAASVVHLLVRLNVNPDRMAAVGYGEHKPVAANSSADGRQENRRVSLIVKTKPDERKGGSRGSQGTRGGQ
jgi:chemotaxis protein MotB